VPPSRLRGPEPAPVTERPKAVALTPRDAALADRARSVEAAYVRGEDASALLASDLQTFDAASGVDVRATFDGEGLRLDLARTTALGPLAVAFPPGALGEPVFPEGPPSGRSEQDLVPLRAPVIVLPEGAVTASVHVPVACAMYTAGGPSQRRVYRLSRFPAGSPMDRLMAVLCSGEAPPHPADAQLAVWVVRNGVGPGTQGGCFGSGARVTEATGATAARLLERAGLVPSQFGYYQQEPAQLAEPQRVILQEAAPQAPVPVRPRPEVDLDLVPVPPLELPPPRVEG
jgi:hypothetical protein